MVELMLFERLADGRLVQVPRNEAEARRRERPYSAVHLGTVEILWTDDEIAARRAEEAAAARSE